MKKMLKSVLSLPVLFSLFFLGGCLEEGALGDLGGNENQPGENVDEITQLNQIYELAKAQGFEGSYEDWLDSLKGDAIELRVSQDGQYIQWKHSSSSGWTNLIPLSQITGEDGQDGEDGKDGVDGEDGEDGLTPYIGENGNWWIGDKDTKVSAYGKGDKGDNGKDGQTPYIGHNGHWWIGNADTGVKAEGKGDKGDKGDTGKSAYEIFMEENPNYTGDESQWLEDLLNGKLGDSNYKYYSVSFDLDGGIITDEEFDYEFDVFATHAISKPEATPIKAGYIFAGLYVDGNKWSFDTNVVLKDIVLKAHWVKASIDPDVDFINVVASKDAVTFGLDVDDVSSVMTVELYREGRFVQSYDTIDDYTNIGFEGLHSDTEYRLEVKYTYNLNDGMGDQVESDTTTFKTLAKEIPTYQFNNLVAGADNVSFAVSEIDEDNVGYISNYEIYLDGNVIDRISGDIVEPTFENLLANHEYTVVANYAYDLNDLNGEQYGSVSSTFRTTELFVPTVTLNNVFVTDDTIEGEIIVNDPSEITKLTDVSIYNGDSFVAYDTDEFLEFTNLNSNTTYTIVATYEYDIKDGNGLVERQASFEVTTHPTYILQDTNILNTSAILDGDLVYIHAVVENPSNSRFTKIQVNGKEYDVDPASTTTNIYTYIPYIEIGMNQEFVVEKLVAELDGSKLVYYTSNNNAAVASIYERLDLVSVDLMDNQFEVRDYFFASEDIYLRFNFDLPENTSYEISEIKLSNGQTYTLDDLMTDDNGESYYIALEDDYWDAWKSVTVTSYSYTNEVIGDREVSCNIVSNKALRLVDDEINYISSAEDLMAITSERKYYQLTNDIDLSDMEWKAIPELYGVLDGNGYAIQNLRLAKTYNNTSFATGLFNSVNGVICNLDLESLVIMVDINKTDIYNYTYYIGGFAAYSNTAIYNNCHIDENSSISVKAVRYGSAGADGYVGGFTGSASDSNTLIINSSNRANISVIGNNVNMNSGVFTAQSCWIKNSFNTGNLTTNNGKSSNIFMENCGGLVDHCYNTGALNGNYDVSIHSINTTASLSLGQKFANQVVDFETPRTYSFEVNGGEFVENINDVMILQLPTPVKDGYYFAGWYENEYLTGEPVVTPYFSLESTTLYAKWLKKVGFDESLITNDLNNPFTFNEDGVLVSTIDNRYNIDEYATATYRINADRTIRVYYNYNYEEGYGNGGSYSINSNRNIYHDYEKGMYYVDLSVGDYLEFYIYSYEQNEGVLYISDFVIVELA